MIVIDATILPNKANPNDEYFINLLMQHHGSMRFLFGEIAGNIRKLNEFIFTRLFRNLWLDFWLAEDTAEMIYVYMEAINWLLAVKRSLPFSAKIRGFLPMQAEDFARWYAVMENQDLCLKLKSAISSVVDTEADREKACSYIYGIPSIKPSFFVLCVDRDSGEMALNIQKIEFIKPEAIWLDLIAANFHFSIQTYDGDYAIHGRIGRCKAPDCRTLFLMSKYTHSQSYCQKNCKARHYAQMRAEQKNGVEDQKRKPRVY